MELPTTLPGGQSWLATKLDFVVNWARRNSLWPMPFGTACCAIEMMAGFASRFDLARFGMERMSFSPRQADVLICAGRVPYKMAAPLRKVWDQMPQPKWAVSMGACASTGGIFDAYSMVQGIDTIIPVDVYVPGCPPRPDGLIYGLLLLHEKVKGESVMDAEVRRALRYEDPDAVGRPNLPSDVVSAITGPFGSSTKQNLPSGMVGIRPGERPRDRLP